MDTKDILINDKTYISSDINEISNYTDKDVSVVLLGFSNIDVLSNVNGIIDKTIIITKEEIKVNGENIQVKNRITKSLIRNLKKIIVLINLDDNYENTKYIIKNYIKLKNIIEIYKIKFGKRIGNKTCIGIVNSNNSAYLNDIIVSIKAMNKKEIDERLSYVYDEACDYLDSQFRTNNYCEFHADDTCIANRNGTAAHSEMGCCYSFKYGSLFSKDLIQNLGICEHLDCKSCSTKCMSCKMFTCKELKSKRNRI